jgi:heptosyltransferase-1
MLANDTGPLHLAAAIGTPCVAPYTCTRVAKHGPYGIGHTGIETGVACAGSYLRNCPNGMICMDDLTPAKLWPALRNVFSQVTLCVTCKTAESPPLRFGEGAGG